MTANVFADDVGGVLAETIGGNDGDVYAVNFGAGTIPALVFRLHDLDDPPTVKLLVDWDDITAATDDFMVAGHAADLVAADALSVRLLPDLPRASLFVSGSEVVSLVHAGDGVGGLTATESAFVEDAWRRYDEAWVDAEPHSLRTPPITDVRETLAAELGRPVLDDFDAILGELSSVTGEDGPNEVTLVLFAAARHDKLLYEVSKWGEDVGLASKATFSVTTTPASSRSLFDREKVALLARLTFSPHLLTS